MEKKTIKCLERALKGLCLRRSAGNYLQTQEDEDLQTCVDYTIGYFEIFDVSENTCMRKIFETLFLKPKNYRKNLVGLAMEVGYSRSSLLRYKQRVMKVFQYIYEKLDSSKN